MRGIETEADARNHFDAAGCTKLWAAVLARAVEDGDMAYLGSRAFLDVCTIAGLNPEWTERTMRKAIEAKGTAGVLQRREEQVIAYRQGAKVKATQAAWHRRRKFLRQYEAARRALGLAVA